MDNKDWIVSLSNELEIPLPDEQGIQKFRTVLAGYISDLVENNFEKLIHILYRLDISESKLKQLLKEKIQNNAGMLIADMIIERQLQKINQKKEFRKEDTGSIDEDERW